MLIDRPAIVAIKMLKEKIPCFENSLKCRIKIQPHASCYRIISIELSQMCKISLADFLHQNMKFTGYKEHCYLTTKKERSHI